MMKKKHFNYLTTGIGVVLLVGGLILLKLLVAPQGMMLVLPYILVGVGCGAFGHGLGDIVNDKVLEQNPKRKKQMDIEKVDERNIAISNQAKAKAYDSMLSIFGTLMIAFAFMSVDVMAVLLFVAAYLLVVGFFVFYLNKYQNEM